MIFGFCIYHCFVLQRNYFYSVVSDKTVFFFLSRLFGFNCMCVGKGTKVIEAHFLATGRLSSLRSTVRAAFRFLLLQLSVPALASRAWETMQALAELEADHGESTTAACTVLR